MEKHKKILEMNATNKKFSRCFILFSLGGFGIFSILIFLRYKK